MNCGSESCLRVSSIAERPRDALSVEILSIAVQLYEKSCLKRLPKGEWPWSSLKVNWIFAHQLASIFDRIKCTSLNTEFVLSTMYVFKQQTTTRCTDLAISSHAALSIYLSICVSSACRLIAHCSSERLPLMDRLLSPGAASVAADEPGRNFRGKTAERNLLMYCKRSVSMSTRTRTRLGLARTVLKSSILQRWCPDSRSAVSSVTSK